MSLTKKVYLTISGYDIKLSDNLTFYQKDQLKLIFYINEYSIDYENNATTRALMPVNPLNAILFIENPEGVDSVSSAKIEDNAVTFYLDSTHTQYVGISRMQLRLFDQDGCAITLPHFTFEIRENIYGSGDVRFQNVVMVDHTGTVILTEDNDMLDVGDILTMGTEVAYPQVAKTIKELPVKNNLDGTEKLIVEDNEATKQAPLTTIVDEIKQNSQEKIREIESELAQTNAQLSTFGKQITGGSLNDYDLLNQAINENDVVIISGVLNINKKITISNKESVTLKFADGGGIKHGLHTLFEFNNVKRVIVENGVFTGDYISTQPSNNEFLIDIKGTIGTPLDEVLISGVKFINQNEVINVYRSNKVVVKDCYFDNIYAFGVSDIFCKNVSIENNYFIGRGSITGLPIEDKIGQALSMSSRSENIHFSSNKIYNSIGDGAKAEGCKNVFYSNNLIDTYGKDGLKVMHCTHYGAEYNTTDGFEITNNIIRNGKKWRVEDSGAITLNGCKNGVVSGNTILNDKSHLKYGIVSSHWKEDGSPDVSPSENIKIDTNIIMGCYPFSVAFLSNPSGYYDVTVSNNKMDSACKLLHCRSSLTFVDNKIVLSDNENNALEVLYADTVIADYNTFIGGNTNAVYFDCSRLRFRNNEVRLEESNLTTRGLYSKNAIEITVSNNRFQNAYRAITFDASQSKNILIEKNYLDNVLDTPITLANHSNSNTINDLTCLSIIGNVINGYYTQYNDGLGIIWLIMKNINILNLQFDGNVIEKSENCMKNIYPSNLIFADYQNNVITNLINGKSLINSELVTLTELISTNKF